MNNHEKQPQEQGVLLRRAGCGISLGGILVGSAAEVVHVITQHQFLLAYGVSTAVGIATAISTYRADCREENAFKKALEAGQQRSDVVESIGYAQKPDASPVNA